ncbi:MAG TPA: acyltransferase family protein [Gemmatimonadaceae bacterium]|nr:acyltransferase family protein [Gemmatimonadaceae bacterium]
MPYFVLAPCLIGVAGILARVMPPSGRQLNVPLESLRGLCAMSVFFSHVVVSYFYFQTGKWTPPPTAFYGFLGPGPVILFFFLSGFLFWSKCLAHDGVGNYWTFLAGRARRLVPAYYVSVVIVLLLSPRRSLGEVAQWLLFLPTHSVVNASVTWTLMFEVIFYLLLPLLFFLFKGYRIGIYLAIAAAVSWMLARQGFVAFTPAVVRAGVVTFTVFALNSVFGFGFGIGMLVAVLHARVPKRWWQVLRQRRLTPIPLFFLAAPVLFNVGPYSAAEFWLLSVVFVFVVAGNDFFGFLSSKAAFQLGTVSYSFYITHGIVLFVCSHLYNRWFPISTVPSVEYWSWMGIVGVIAVCVATVLYWTVERRFMQPHAKSAVSPELISIRATIP